MKRTREPELTDEVWTVKDIASELVWALAERAPPMQLCEPPCKPNDVARLYNKMTCLPEPPLGDTASNTTSQLQSLPEEIWGIIFSFLGVPSALHSKREHALLAKRVSLLTSISLRRTCRFFERRLSTVAFIDRAHPPQLFEKLRILEGDIEPRTIESCNLELLEFSMLVHAIGCDYENFKASHDRICKTAVVSLFTIVDCIIYTQNFYVYKFLVHEYSELLYNSSAYLRMKFMESGNYPYKKVEWFQSVHYPSCVELMSAIKNGNRQYLDYLDDMESSIDASNVTPLLHYHSLYRCLTADGAWVFNEIFDRFKLTQMFTAEFITSGPSITFYGTIFQRIVGIKQLKRVLGIEIDVDEIVRELDNDMLDHACREFYRFLRNFGYDDNKMFQFLDGHYLEAVMERKFGPPQL